jgi:hypothetical protein
MEGAPVTDIVPAVECASWCKDGAGHTDVHDPADQHCESHSRRVPLVQHQLLGGGAEPRAHDQLVGLIRREPGASAPRIMVQHNDATVIDLSVEDARQLALELLKLAEAT